MKTPLYAVAAVGIGVAGFFSFQKIEMHQAELDATNTSKKATLGLEAENKKSQNIYDPMPVENQSLEDSLAELTADLESKGDEKDLLERKIKQLNSKILVQKEEIEKVKGLLAKIEGAFDGQDVPINEIPDFVKKLEDERDTLQSEHEELLAVVEATNKKLEASQGRLDGYNKREVERARNLNQNGISSLITAVNSQWGFVVIKPHPGAVITEDSKLIIVRGGQHLGRVSINSVEADRIIADIDYDSLVAGSRVRAGDSVILAKASTH